MSSPSLTLFIPTLPAGTTATQLEDHFKNAAGFASCRIRAGRDDCPIGFVVFETLKNAEEAMLAMKNSPFHGFQIKLMYSSDQSRSQLEFCTSGHGQTLYLSQLPPDATKRELGHIFRQFYGFLEIQMFIREHKPLDQRVGAFILFETPEHAALCLGSLRYYRFSESDQKPIHIEFARGPTRTFLGRK